MFGQLGTGTTTWSATPTAVTMPTNVTFTAINAGFTHTCALTASGTAYCWGNNIFGQLGDGSTEDSTTPVAVVMPAGVTFVAIVVSTYHTCALTASGNVYCWGINRTNQLGNGTTTDSSVPLIVTMPTGITFSSIATSGYSTCALTASGAAYCWGSNTFGQLGIGSTSNAAVPTAVTMPTGITFVFISVGRYHTCALTASGAAYCWGLNLGGSLGNGTTTNSTVPVAVTMPSGITFDTISTGWNHTCALTAAGIAYCWGQNSGQVGDGSTTNRTTPMLVSMPTGMTFTDIMAGATHTCALAGNGLAYCWGTNTNGQLGLCNCITYTRPSQVGMACATNTATATITVTPSDTRTSTTTQTPSLTRTPTNTHTPSNTRTETNTPTNTRTPSKTRTYTPSNTATATPQQLALKKAAIGNLFVIGLLQDGTLVAWGKTTGSIIPITLKGKTFIDVAATLDTVFALESDGTLRYFGACSDGLCTVPDDAKTDIIAIGAGARFAYAVRSDNTIIGWGKNDFAQVTIPSFATNIIAVDGGARHVVALRADGTVVGWGDNSLGQARQPDGLKNIVAVSAGEDHSCALSNVGEVICWGGGSKSAWGTIPKGTKDYIKIAAGRFCTLAIKADGTLMRWGKEDFSFTGQITDAIVVASDNQNSVVGLRNNGVRVAGSNFEGVFTTRTPTITPTP
jgi:alpha-tubulin suppressor-like RCC1 family protein